MFNSCYWPCEQNKATKLNATLPLQEQNLVSLRESPWGRTRSIVLLAEAGTSLCVYFVPFYLVKWPKYVLQRFELFRVAGVAVLRHTCVI